MFIAPAFSNFRPLQGAFLSFMSCKIGHRKREVRGIIPVCRRFIYVEARPNVFVRPFSSLPPWQNSKRPLRWVMEEFPYSYQRFDVSISSSCMFCIPEKSHGCDTTKDWMLTVSSCTALMRISHEAHWENQASKRGAWSLQIYLAGREMSLRHPLWGSVRSVPFVEVLGADLPSVSFRQRLFNWIQLQFGRPHTVQVLNCSLQ